ncbi:WD repeat-containing protein 62-like [Rhinophrynus dorsalis]
MSDGTGQLRVLSQPPAPPSPPVQRKSSRGQQGASGNVRGHRQVELEKVLGITVSSNSSITCDRNSGLIAYPAGCVTVLLCPRKNKQTHIFNTCSKPISALSFSPDGKFIVTGESGHKPAVRIWDVTEKVMVAEMLGHKYGVSCVCFSPNMKYVVSVGYQHDMVVNVWDWKGNNIVAKNKISSKVSAVSISEDSSYFVTVGNRHVKFWYMESSKKLQVNGTVPLVGRSGLLGDLHDNIFCGVACGKGSTSGSTFCIANSGVLCKFSEKRVLEKWIKLKVIASCCLCVTEKFVFCGCVEGIVRIFNAQNLQYIADLPKPHYLGVDVALGLDPSALFTKHSDSSYPDTSALVYDECNQWLCCVYNDHSLYVWDVNDTRKVGKVYSALYHSSFVWNVELYPEVEQKQSLPPGSFFTCSSDNTIRLWNIDKTSNVHLGRNIYSNDMRKVIYVDNNIQYLKDTSGISEKSDARDAKSGIRVLKIRHDGQHLASGDRTGNIRIYDLGIFDELLMIEAHEGEVLCLEYSKPITGVTLLASASRDRLIHVLNVQRDYTLEQTLDDHSSSITSVKFAGDKEQMHMISCGADKSIYFRPAQTLADGINFLRLHHAVEKTTLYDMDVDLSQKTVAVACQDKNIRLYSVQSGKQEKALKSSPSGGALLKVRMDPSGMFFATSCSNKNISFFDLQSGECMAAVYGHADLVTDMKFTYDCKRLITVSGDSCVFIWQLDPTLTTCMRQHLYEMAPQEKPRIPRNEKCPINIRGEAYPTDFLEDHSHDDLFMDKSSETEDSTETTPLKNFREADPTFLQTNGKLPMWVRKLDGDKDKDLVNITKNNYQPRGRWAESDGNIIIKSLLDAEDQSYYGSPNLEKTEESILHDQVELEFVEPKNFQHLLEQSETGNDECPTSETFILDASTAYEDNDVKAQSIESIEGIFYPSSLQLSQQEESDFAVEEHQIFSETFDMRDGKSDFMSNCLQDGDEGSLTSETCSECDLDENDLAETSRPPTPEEEKFLMKHFDTLTDDYTEERFDYSLNDLKPSEDDDNDFFMNPRLSISSRFLLNFQRANRLADSMLPNGEHTATSIDTLGKPEPERLSNSRRSIEKPTEDNTEGPETKKDGKGTGTFFCLIHHDSLLHDVVMAELADEYLSRMASSLQKVQDKKTASRSSFPGCWPSKGGTLGRSSKARSYMEATASSKAKILRSVSMGDNINTSQTEDHRRISNLLRPASSNDLFSMEHNKNSHREENASKPHFLSTSHDSMTWGNHETKGKTSSHASKELFDKLLMPPPTTCCIVPRLKRKAKSVSNLSKSSGKEEENGVVLKDRCGEAQRRGVKARMETNSFRRSSLSVSRTTDVPEPPRRASLHEFPTHTNHSCVTDHIPGNSTEKQSHVESSVTSSDMFASDTAPCFSMEKPCVKVLLERVNHGVKFPPQEDRSLIESCGGSPEEMLHLKSLFSKAFDHMRSEMDLVGKNPSTNTTKSKRKSVTSDESKNNPTLDLLEHYSEIMLTLMREKSGSK